MKTLYDRNGKAVAYIDDDGQSVYLYNGAPVAWLSGESMYAYSGRHLGWFLDGWVVDHDGDHAFFTTSAATGPLKPVRQVRPVRGVRGVRPVRGVRAVAPVRSVRSLAWSRFSDESFFRR